MKKIFLLSLLLLFFATEAAAATKLEGLKVFTDSKGEMLEFKFNFTSAFKGQIKTSFFEKSVQVDLSGATIEPSSRNFSVSDEYIKSIRALQYQPDIVRIRFNLLKNNIDVEGAFKHISTGSEITFFLNKSKISLPKKDAATKPVTSKKKEMARPNVLTKNDAEFDAKFANIASMMSGEVETGVAYAAETGPETEKNLSVVPDIYSSAMKMIFYLSVILAGIFIVLKMLKKKGIVGGKKSLFGKEKAIKVVERTYIDNKKSLAIAEVCGEYMILGIGENTINYIGKLDGDQKTRFITESEKKPVPSLMMERATKQPQQTEEPANKAKASKKKIMKGRLSSLMRGGKSEEAFMELLAEKFTSYEEAPEKPVEKPIEKTEAKQENTSSIIAEINHENEEEKAKKVLEMLKNKAVAMQDEPAAAPKTAIKPEPKAPVQEKQAPEVDMIAQDYFSRKNKLKYV